MHALSFIESRLLRSDVPKFRSGDTIRVHVKIKEGEKERVQAFEGVCIRRRGDGVRETFTVRKISFGIGVGSDGLAYTFHPRALKECGIEVNDLYRVSLGIHDNYRKADELIGLAAVYDRFHRGAEK